jgi:heme exporter protein D
MSGIGHVLAYVWHSTWTCVLRIIVLNIDPVLNEDVIPRIECNIHVGMLSRK